MQENRVSDSERAANVVRMAGGRIIGRTRFQKIAYLLEITGISRGFSFEYRYYGPYSEDLSLAVSTAKTTGIIKEEESPTQWGGWYSIFTTPDTKIEVSSSVRSFVDVAAKANPVALELAATAAYFAISKDPDPWDATVIRKPEKAKLIGAAKQLYAELEAFDLPTHLPAIKQG